MLSTRIIFWLIVLFPSISFAYDPNLVGYWKFDETGNSIAYDSAGDKNGTLYGNAAWSNPGKVNGCVALDGSGDYVQINNTNAAPLIPTGSDFTISVWFKMDNCTGTQALYGYYSESSYNYWAYSLYMVSGNIYFSIGNGTASKEVGALNNTPIISNRWYHIITIFDQSQDTISCFIDGHFIKTIIVAHTGIYPQAGTGNKRELIGASYAGNHWNMDGFVDEVKVWTRCFSVVEIGQEYEYSKLAGYWKMDGTAIDSSGNNNDGTLNGNAAWSEMGKVNGCVDLDGNDDYVQINDTNDPPLIPTGSEFTISLWFKMDTIAGTQATLWILF